jgi:hypothetical protein
MLLYNNEMKVEDASRERFDRLACLTGSLAEYVSGCVGAYPYTYRWETAMCRISGVRLSALASWLSIWRYC